MHASGMPTVQKPAVAQRMTVSAICPCRKGQLQEYCAYPETVDVVKDSHDSLVS